MAAADESIWSRGTLESVDACPACGGTEADVSYRRRDNAGEMPDNWTMMRCLGCRSLYLNPRPDEQSLPRAYHAYYTHSVDVEDLPLGGAKGLLWRLINGFLNRRFGLQRHPAAWFGYPFFHSLLPLRQKLDYYGRHLTAKRFPNRGHLLDIGCGNGAFLARAQEMGWNACGCEPDEKAAAAAKSLGLDVLHGDVFHTRLNDRQFSVITISHVVEHVCDPLQLLERACELLEPGGTLWLAVPNPDSLCLRIFGNAWNGLHFPFHLCVPSQRSIKRWIEDAGFASPRTIRRGMHVRNTWRESMEIALRDDKKLPPKFVQSVQRIAIDGISAVSRRWADETVLVAQKPVAKDAT